MERELWFSREEYQARVRKVQDYLRESDLDMLLAFHPESVTYLTGFFTKGFLTFQFAIIPVDRDPVVVCRDVEVYYLDRTGAFAERILWSDGEDLDMAASNAVRRVGGRSVRIGIEKGAWPLNAQRFEGLSASLSDVRFVDLTSLVPRLRAIKSPAEIAYQRRAARIAELGMDAGVAAATAGVSEREFAAAVTAAMIRAGSDWTEPGPIASGERAHHIHGTYSDRVLQRGDTVHLEVTPCVRYYHARFMRPIKVAHATEEERELARRLITIQDKAIAEVAPGVPANIPDRVYREGIRATGAVADYPNKTFYGVGLMIYPTAERLEATPGSTWVFEPGMTFHTYLIVRDLCFSETILVTPGGHEQLTRYRRELLIA